jgi:hypothetical protein
MIHDLIVACLLGIIVQVSFQVEIFVQGIVILMAFYVFEDWFELHGAEGSEIVTSQSGCSVLLGNGCGKGRLCLF